MEGPQGVVLLQCSEQVEEIFKKWLNHQFKIVFEKKKQIHYFKILSPFAETNNKVAIIEKIIDKNNLVKYKIDDAIFRHIKIDDEIDKLIIRKILNEFITSLNEFYYLSQIFLLKNNYKGNELDFLWKSNLIINKITLSYLLTISVSLGKLYY